MQVLAIALWCGAAAATATAQPAPPVGTAPVDAPPVDAPPVDAPPADAPPVDAPPVDVPPAAVIDPPLPTRPVVVRTARSLEGAPLPNQVSGMSRREPESIGNNLRIVPRVLLFVPRIVLEVGNAPVRGVLYLFDRYSLSRRVKDVLFNDDGTIGVYPTAGIQTGFGFTVGARFVHKDLFGEGEKFGVGAEFGGTYNQRYSAELSTGTRLGRRLKLSLEGEYEIDPRNRFFGIGNGDEVETTMAPVDPYDDPVAIDTRYRETVTRAYARARVKLFGAVSARLTSGVMWKSFGESSPEDLKARNNIVDHYLTDELPGFRDGAAYSYNELELRYDTRRPSTIWETINMPSTGWLILGYGGIARGFDRAPTRYVRYGGDVQRFFRIATGPRVLALRVMAEEVRGDSDAIPFTDLPVMGGQSILRGYVLDRFRDKAIATATAEYQFDLSYLVAGFLFADAGRTFNSLSEATIDGIRVGFGGGLQLHGTRSYVGRLTLATSIDGGFFFSVNFNRAFDPRKRLELD